MNQNENKVYDKLKSLGINYEVHEHPPVLTVEDAQKYWSNIEGAQCKNLFLRNQKGKFHYLIIMEESKRVDMSKLASQIGENKLSFASDQRLEKYLGLKTGAVSPFGLINDENHVVEVKIDKDLKKTKIINFHPNVNTATISISFKDFEKFLKEQTNDVEYINI